MIVMLIMMVECFSFVHSHKKLQRYTLRLLFHLSVCRKLLKKSLMNIHEICYSGVSTEVCQHIPVLVKIRHHILHVDLHVSVHVSTELVLIWSRGCLKWKQRKMRNILSRVCCNYYKMGFRLLTGFIGLQVSYTQPITTESLIIATDSHNWVTAPAESLQGAGPPADPTHFAGSSPKTATTGTALMASLAITSLTHNWNTDSAQLCHHSAGILTQLNYQLYSWGTRLFLLLRHVFTVPLLRAYPLPSNCCKQTPHCLQRARHIYCCVVS
jgi:hypothetical protein